MKDSVFKEQLDEIQSQVESLSSKANQFSELLEKAEAEAYERGLKIGLSASVQDVKDRTIVIFAPKKEHDAIMSSAKKFYREQNCRIIVLTEEADLKDLSDIDLKAWGLKRQE